MTGTMQDFIDATSKQGAEIGKDFAYAMKFEYRHDTQTNVPCEAKVVWIAAGGYPSEFPPETTAQDKLAKQHWEKRWTIIRCAEQPKPTRVNLKIGKFLPGGMPNIKIEK